MWFHMFYWLQPEVCFRSTFKSNFVEVSLFFPSHSACTKLCMGLTTWASLSVRLTYLSLQLKAQLANSKHECWAPYFTQYPGGWLKFPFHHWGNTFSFLLFFFQTNFLTRIVILGIDLLSFPNASASSIIYGLTECLILHHSTSHFIVLSKEIMIYSKRVRLRALAHGNHCFYCAITYLIIQRKLAL